MQHARSLSVLFRHVRIAEDDVRRSGVGRAPALIFWVLPQRAY